MKQTFFAIALVFYATFCCKVNAQWTSDVSVNTPLTNSGKCGDQLSATTSDGKTYILWGEEDFSSNYYSHFQLLDKFGNKMWEPNGIIPFSRLYNVSDLTVDKFDNAVILTDYYDSTSMNYKLAVFKLDTTGNQLWGSQGITLDGYIGTSIIVNNSNEVYVSSWEGSIWKIAANGTLLWTSPIHVPEPDTTTGRCKLIPNEDNGFTALYVSISTPPVDGVLKTMRYDENGNTKWVNDVQVSSYNTHSYQDFYYTSDGYNGFITAYTVIPNFHNGDAQKVDSAGNKLWGTDGVLISASVTKEIFVTGIEYLPSVKEFWIIAQQMNQGQNGSGTIVQNIDSNGLQLLGNNGKELSPIDSNFSPGGIRNVNDGLIYFYYKIVGFSGDFIYQIFAEKIDYVGNTLWKKTICSVSSYKYWGSSGPFKNNQIIFVWADSRNTNTSGDNDIFAQNINKDGNPGPAGIENPQTTKMDFDLYPNPAIDGVYIDCADRKGSKMQIFNIIGNRVFQSDLTSGTNVIDISSLTTGIYVVRLTSADGIFQRKLIKN